MYFNYLYFNYFTTLLFGEKSTTTTTRAHHGAPICKLLDYGTHHLQTARRRVLLPQRRLLTEKGTSASLALVI